MSSVANIREMWERDIRQILDIERDSWRHPWPAEDFYECRRADCTCLVAEQQERVVGYLIYGIFGKTAQVLNLTVQRQFRRQGIASSLLRRAQQGNFCREVIVIVNEYCVPAQLFLKAQGFRAFHVDHGYFANPAADAYLFRATKQVQPLHGTECEDEPGRRRGR